MMEDASEHAEGDEQLPEAEGLVQMRVDWDGFERVLDARGDCPRPKLAYLDGVLELMSPGQPHDHRSRNLFMLLGVYFEAIGVEYSGTGGWLLRRRLKEAGVEPDESFIFGPAFDDSITRPDLAIEIVWSRGGLDKLEIYRRLEVPEVWFWIKGRIRVYVLDGGAYREAGRSARFPELDLALLARLMEIRPTTEAVRQLRAALRPGG